MTEGRVQCFETCLFLVDFSRCFLNNLLHASALASLLGMTQNSPSTKGKEGTKGKFTHCYLLVGAGGENQREREVSQLFLP